MRARALIMREVSWGLETRYLDLFFFQPNEGGLCSCTLAVLVELWQTFDEASENTILKVKCIKVFYLFHFLMHWIMYGHICHSVVSLATTSPYLKLLQRQIHVSTGL